MAIDKYEDLDAMQLDVLREVGNIGSGNATTALSSMIGKMVDIEVPSVRILGFQDAIDAAGGAEKVVAGILVRLDGDIDGMMLFLLEEDLVAFIVEAFFGRKVDTMFELSDTERSALQEMGNIMASSYVNAIAQLAGMTINVDIPVMSMDMLGAIMSVPAIEMGEMGDKLLYIDNNMIIDNINVKSKMMLVPTIGSLDNLLVRLGVA